MTEPTDADVMEFEEFAAAVNALERAAEELAAVARGWLEERRVFRGEMAESRAAIAGSLDEIDEWLNHHPVMTEDDLRTAGRTVDAEIPCYQDAKTL